MYFFLGMKVISSNAVNHPGWPPKGTKGVVENVEYDSSGMNREGWREVHVRYFHDPAHEHSTLYKTPPYGWEKDTDQGEGT